jgi:uncharacterized RDD family membrane protein YckC
VSTDPSARALVTPEAVPLDLETATVGSRAVAYLLDLLVMATGYLLLGIASAILGGGGFVPGWVGITLLLLLVFALQFGYPIGFETLWRGRTPGKAAMGLRVVTDEAAPVGLRHATIRATVGIFELLMLLGLPAVISSLVSARGQRLGDLAAGTIVVRERRATGGLEVEVFTPPPGHEGYTAQLDVSAIGPRDYATIRDTLRRLPTLPDHATRWHVAQQVAGQYTGRVSPPPPSSASAETWLRCVAAAVQARRQASPSGPPAARPTGGPDRRRPPMAPTPPVVPTPPTSGPAPPTSGPAPPTSGPALPTSRPAPRPTGPVPPGAGSSDRHADPPGPSSTGGFVPPG